MSTTVKSLSIVLALTVSVLVVMGCGGSTGGDGNGGVVSAGDADIIFLHHSAGENIWNGGVLGWFDQYAAQTGIRYQIAEQYFPKDSPYGWENYPYDYWNIWVNHAGSSPYMSEPTLEILKVIL